MAEHAASTARDEPPAEAASLPLPVVLDVRGLACPDLATIDALARIALEVRREGGTLRLRGAVPDLRELIELAGLRRVLR